MKYNRTTTGIIKDIDLLKKTYFSTPELIGPIQLAILHPFFYNTYMYILDHPKRFDPCSIHPNHSWHTWGDSSWSIWCTEVNNSPPRAILFLVLHLFMNYDVYKWTVKVCYKNSSPYQDTFWTMCVTSFWYSSTQLLVFQFNILQSVFFLHTRFWLLFCNAGWLEQVGWLFIWHTQPYGFSITLIINA